MADASPRGVNPAVAPAAAPQQHRDAPKMPEKTKANDIQTTSDADDASKLSDADDASKPSKADDASESEADVASKPSEADDARTELELVRAQTMHDMVETLETGQRLLFLTQKQTCAIAASPNSIALLLKHFGVATDEAHPQLVINLLFSGGFERYTKHCTEDTMNYRAESWAAGMKFGRTPFLERTSTDSGAEATCESLDTSEEAEERIDQFMEQCLVPLAIRTHAVVICDAINSQNILSVSFNRISTVLCRKYGAAGDACPPHPAPLTSQVTPTRLARCLSQPRTAVHRHLCHGRYGLVVLLH